MKRLLLAAMLFAAISANAQFDEKKNEIPFINVTGTAEKEVVPDIIYITISLADKVVNKDNYTITAQDNKLKEGLRSIGIDVKNLALSGASSDIVKRRRKDKSVLDERKNYVLKVSSATEVSKVFEMLHTINIDETEVAQTDHTQMESLRKEVRISAIKAAKDKAVYLLEAIGEQLGKPLMIVEENSYVTSTLLYQTNVVNRYDGGESIEENEPDFKKLKIKFSYNIKYSIK